MNKKILTLEQLAKFCAENKMYKFSSEETGYKLCVQVPSTYEKFEEKSTDTMLYGKIKLLHTNRNRNTSNVTYDAAKNCMSTIKYKPLLANFCEIDGVKDFTSHDMEFDKEGNVEYIEHQIGCFTVDEPYLEYDEEKDRHYLYAYVAIPREYTDAADIIERKGGTKVSAELSINSMSYDAKAKELVLEDIEVMGATCLGKDPETGEDIQEGMEGARLDIQDFSTENNSVKFEQNNEITKLLHELNDKVEALSSSYTEKLKEGGKYEVNKFEELLNKYNKAIEDITFEYEGLSDEELELAFAEAFVEVKKKVEDDDASVISEDTSTPAENNKQDDNTPATPSEEHDVNAQSIEDEESDETDSEDAADNDADTENFSEGENPENAETEEVKVEEDAETEENSEETDPIDEEPTAKMSIEINGVKKEFSVSMNQKLEAISNLVNDTYADDMTWYCCEVYDDEKKVVMIDYWNGRAYRQSYKCKNDVYSLTGDRVSVYSTWMSADEQKAFDKMKADFAEMSTKFEEVSSKLSKYEAEPDKMAVLESDEYSSIADKAEFAELKEMKNHFDLSIDEIKAKADQIIVQYAKAGALTFAFTENNNVGAKKLVALNAPKKRSRYGGLGKKDD